MSFAKKGANCPMSVTFSHDTNVQDQKHSDSFVCNFHAVILKHALRTSEVSNV